MGLFEAEIFLDRMPVTASNFIDMVVSGLYNDRRVNRDIPSCIECTGIGGISDGVFRNLKTGCMEFRRNGGQILNEFTSRDSNERGTLSKETTDLLNTDGSRFFINVTHNRFMDWFSPRDLRGSHLVFGQITKGCDDVFEAIAVAPIEPMMINSITIRM